MPKWLLTLDQMKETIEQPIKKETSAVLYEKAYWQWYRDYWCKEFDDDCHALSKVEIPISSGWLRLARNAQLDSARTLANKLKITESSYMGLEKNEIDKKISIQRMIDIAEAVNCEVVYFLRPKRGARISEHVWHRLYQTFKDDERIKATDEKRRHKVFAAIVKREFAKMSFRKQRGWSLKKDEVSRKAKSQFFEYHRDG